MIVDDEGRNDGSGYTQWGWGRLSTTTVSLQALFMSQRQNRNSVLPSRRRIESFDTNVPTKYLAFSFVLFDLV